jgi:hypothetical protein
MKKFFMSLILGLVAGSLYAQSNVQITITALDPPINQNFRMVITNNNAVTWRVKQVYVLYTTGNVLQSTLTPANWTAASDVPWDAIPQKSLLYETATSPILPGGNSKTFEFQSSPPTALNDFYVNFFVTNASGSSTQNFIQRVYVTPRTDLPKDSIGTEEIQVSKTSAGGLLGSSNLRAVFAFPVPATRYQIEVFDQEGSRRDFVQYPPNNPTTLNPFFRGNVSRTMDATGAAPGDYWRICVQNAEWCSASLGLRDLAWTRGAEREQKPIYRWHFSPSFPDTNEGRFVRFYLTNPSTQNFMLVRNLSLFLQGQRNLECGSDLNTWPQRFPRDVHIPFLQLQPLQQFILDIPIPAGVPPRRFFYGAMDLFAPEDPIELPTRVFFSHEEVIRVPLISGISQVANANLQRQVRVSILNPNNGAARTYGIIANEHGGWRVELNADILTIPTLYQPVWEVRVKPKGALQKLFTNVLLIGGDPIDPYLRQSMILGDVNGDNRIDESDLLRVLFDFGTNNPDSDLNGSGLVDDVDLLLVLFNYGQVGDE